MEKKRGREEISDDESASPVPKRFHADVLLDILNDDENEVDSGERGCDADADGLASVMKSLEEEIAQSSPPPAPTLPASELGYLLKASDDELGLPPVTPSSSESTPAAAADAEEVAPGLEFGQLWGFEDEIISGSYDPYNGLGFGIDYDDGSVSGFCVPDDTEEIGVLFCSGLFDGADVVFPGPSDTRGWWSPFQPSDELVKI